MRPVKWIALTVGALCAFGVAAGPAMAADSFFTTPMQAKKINKVPLVTAFERCVGGGTTFDSPFNATSCVPPIQNADVMWGPKGKGTITIALVAKNTKDYNNTSTPDSPDDSDIVITLQLSDLRVASDTTPDDNAKYTGAMGGGTADVRITSTDNVPLAGNGSGTTANTAFPVQDPPGQDCDEGKCKIITSADATVPGVTVDGEKSNIEIGVPHNSSDGQAYVDAPNGEHFATPGIFVP